uniref:Pentraxin (PTX) domain-containing protein n=1 Tax=Hucho hucho TaxID=62062 RepID=A0A4W5NP61_9TELE
MISLLSSTTLCVLWADTALTLESRTLFTYDESYYEYVPDMLPWHGAGRLCDQRSGALATVSNTFENREITTFLKSLNITHPVWIGRKVMTHLQSEFSHYAISIFDSFMISLALLVHGMHGPYQEAFRHDGSWHSLCVSWSRHGGRWALFANGRLVNRGDSLYSAGDMGPDGHFILGQEQDSFGGSFKSAESFSGSLTQLHIWERVLNDSEIHTMEKECSPASSGLAFKWSATVLEVESSLKRLWGDSPSASRYRNRR